jgi:hypothetical protein
MDWASYLTPYDAAFQQRLHDLSAAFAARGSNPITASQQAYGAIYDTLVGQALI